MTQDPRDMTRDPSESTLFHLVPLNDLSVETLEHSDNKRFVSMSPSGKLGLEIGFHVSPFPGAIMARLGRDADLILQQRKVSAVHVAFEMHPETLVMLLSVRSKQKSSVFLEFPVGPREQVDGSCVLGYNKEFIINILSYSFKVSWRDMSTTKLRDWAIQEYNEALRKQTNVRSRHLPTEVDNSEFQTWHNTRIQTARRLLFREANRELRVPVGGGQFGTIFRAVDYESGNPFAIKVIHLSKFTDQEHARSVAHREAKALEKLKHKHIIELLGVAEFHSMEPEIYMPLRPGNLRQLASDKARHWNDDQLAMQVLEQMLSALDYLDCSGFCHRDVKPENILFYSIDGINYMFQLADFGLANHCRMAFTKCGTAYYEAPELHPEYGSYPQSSKMDVWSLFATVIDIHKNFAFPPRNARTYSDIFQAVRIAAQQAPDLATMARENPDQRASAAQLMVKHFDGRGLSTPRARVPPIASPTAPLTPAGTKPAIAAPAVNPTQTPRAQANLQPFLQLKLLPDNRLAPRQKGDPAINDKWQMPRASRHSPANRVKKYVRRPTRPAGPSEQPKDKGKACEDDDFEARRTLHHDASLFKIPGGFPS